MSKLILPIDPRLTIVRNDLILWMDASFKTSYIGSGSTWTDISGNSNNGSGFNSVGFSSDNGGYLTFNGSNQYFQVSTSTSLITGTNRTISIWCRPQAVPTGVALIKIFAGTGGEYYFQFNGSKWTARTFGGTGVVNDADDAVANTWYNLVMTYASSSSLKFYVNGVYKGEDTSPGALQNASGQNLNIGTYLNGNSHFNGDIAQVLIYNTILTADQVTHNYNRTKARFGL